MVPSVVIIVPLMPAGAPCRPSYDVSLFPPSSLVSAVLLRSDLEDLRYRWHGASEGLGLLF
jgi:hypothetical protein